MPLVSFPITKLQNTNPIFLQIRSDLRALKTSLGGVNSYYGPLFSLHCFVHSALTFPEIPKTKPRDFLLWDAAPVKGHCTKLLWYIVPATTSILTEQLIQFQGLSLSDAVNLFPLFCFSLYSNI